MACLKALMAHLLAPRPGAVVDGRVSPVKGNQYDYGAGTWVIVNLNLHLEKRNIEIWPRIDKLPGCPADLVAMVARTVVGA